MRKIENIFLFLTLLSLPTQLGRHFWPNFSYIYSLKIDYLSPTIFFWDILVAGLILVWLLGKPRVNKIALNLFLLFLFTQTLSLFGAASIGAGLVRLEQYIIAGFFGVFLASSDFRTLSMKVYLPLTLGVLGESVIAILQFIKGSTLGLWVLGERSFSLSTPGIAKFDFYGREFLRPYATFPHPNVLAGYLLVVSTLLIRRPVVLMLTYLAIFLTMSRTVIFTGFATALLVLRRKWLLIVIFLLLILSPIFLTRFSSLFNFDNLTVLRREELIGSAWQMFLKSPFYGIGLNNFIPAQAFDLIVGPNRFLQPVHNIFLLALSETGIIGFIGLVVLIAYPMIKSRNYLPWLIIIFLGMFDHYFLTLPQGYRLFFLVWGLSFSGLGRVNLSLGVLERSWSNKFSGAVSEFSL